MDAKEREFGVGARAFDTEVTENGSEVTEQKARGRGYDLGFFALPCSQNGYGAEYFPISENWR